VLLSDLVDWVTGLVDSEILHTKSVLFPHEKKVADLRIWVENNGEFVGAAGARLQVWFKSDIYGHPISSHDAERAVGAGVSIHRRYAHSMFEEKTAGVLAALLDGTRPDHREAACTFEKLVGEGFVKQGTQQKNRFDWRNGERPLKQKHAAQRYHNKALVYEEVRLAGDRFDRITPEVVKAAEALALKNKADGVDRKTCRQNTKKTKLEKIEKTAEKRQKSTKNSFVSPEMQMSLAKTSNPERRALGLIDLDAKRGASKEELTCECEVRSLRPGSGAALRTNPRDPNEKGAPKLSIEDLKVILRPHTTKKDGRYLEMKRSHSDMESGAAVCTGDGTEDRRVRVCLDATPFATAAPASEEAVRVQYRNAVTPIANGISGMLD
jgi:hypothetical protein